MSVILAFAPAHFSRSHRRTEQAPVVMPCAVSSCSFLWLPWSLRKIRCDRATVAFWSLGITQVFSGLRCFPPRCGHGFSFLSPISSQSDVNKKRNCGEYCAEPVDTARNRWMAVHNLRCKVPSTIVGDVAARTYVRGYRMPPLSGLGSGGAGCVFPSGCAAASFISARNPPG